MKTPKSHLLLAMLFVALALTSCCKKVPDYTRLIPDDASVVMRVDVRQIAAKSNFGKGGIVSGKWKQFAHGQLSERARKKMATIMDDPAQMGLDLRDPVLIYYCAERGEYGLVGTMYKPDRFADLLNTLAAETGDAGVSQTGGLRYVTLKDVLLVFNDDWFFATLYDAGQTPLQQAQAIGKRSVSEKNVWAGNEAFKRMCKKTGIIQLYAKGEQLNDIAYNCSDDYIPYQAWGIDVMTLDAVFDIAMERAEARLTVEAVAKDGSSSQIEKIDRLLGGKKHGLNVRLGYDLLTSMGGFEPDDYIIKLVGQLVNYVELIYEGDARLTLRVVTHDMTKNPIESAMDILHKELGA